MTLSPPSGLSWSNLLTILGFAGALTAQWITMSSRQAGVEATIAALQSTVSSMDTRYREAEAVGRASDAELRAAVRIIDGKVTQILMLGYRPGAAPMPR